MDAVATVVRADKAPSISLLDRLRVRQQGGQRDSRRRPGTRKVAGLVADGPVTVVQYGSVSGCDDGHGAAVCVCACVCGAHVRRGERGKKSDVGCNPLLLPRIRVFQPNDGVFAAAVGWRIDTEREAAAAAVVVAEAAASATANKSYPKPEQF